MTILIFGLSGSGKTTLSRSLENLLIQNEYSVHSLNGDLIRNSYKDFDFSLEGRKRQCLRMKELAANANCYHNFVLADFICPTEELRRLFNADFSVWADVQDKCKYPDTTALFEPPKKFDLRVSVQNADFYSRLIYNSITDVKR